MAQLGCELQGVMAPTHMNREVVEVSLVCHHSIIKSPSQFILSVVVVLNQGCIEGILEEMMTQE